MTLLLLALLGAAHGVQPDHAIAAAALAARRGEPAWVAALRVALGHSFALLMLAAVLHVAPRMVDARMSRGATIAGAIGLIVVGAFLLASVWRHSPHDHPHASHGRTPLGVALGWVLGLSGTRVVVMLPFLAGSGEAGLALVAYAAGIAAGIVAVSVGLDAVRFVTKSWLSRRLLDGVFAVGALASGAWLLFTGTT